MPFSLTMAAAGLPVVNISPKTSLPCLLLILPASMRSTSSVRAAGERGHSVTGVLAAPSALMRSLRTQFATVLGLAAWAAAVSK